VRSGVPSELHILLYHRAFDPEFGEEEGEDEPDGPSSDDEHRQMRRVASASPAGEGGEVRVLAAAEPPDRAPVRCKEAPGPAAAD